MDADVVLICASRADRESANIGIAYCQYSKSTAFFVNYAKK